MVNVFRTGTSGGVVLTVSRFADPAYRLVRGRKGFDWGGEMQGQENVQFHGAEVIAVAFDRLSGIVRLSLWQEDGVLRAVYFYGVKAFRDEDLTLQNVVSRFLRSSSGQFSKEGLERWLLLATSLSDAASWLNEERRREWCAPCNCGSV